MTESVPEPAGLDFALLVEVHEPVDGQETGTCERCGAVTEYFGPDPYTSAMCDVDQGTVRACEPGCDCSELKWLCWDCHDELGQYI